MFNTRTARRRLLLLDPARGEGEVGEDSIQQQHNSVVVVGERGNPAGLRQAPRERRRERGRAAPGRGQTHLLAAPKPSSIYRGEGRGCAPSRVSTPRGAAAPIPSKGGGQGGRGGKLASQVRWKHPSPNPRRLGPLWGAHQPTWGWSPPTLGPCSPPGLVAPLGGPPGPSRWSRYVTDKTRNFSGDQNRTSHI